MSPEDAYPFEISEKKESGRSLNHCESERSASSSRGRGSFTPSCYLYKPPLHKNKNTFYSES